MKTFNKAFYFPLLFLIFFSASLNAVQIANDEFTSDLDGYSGTGVTYIPGWMEIAKNKRGSKTYHLGTSNANSMVTIEFRAWTKISSSVYIYINGSLRQSYDSVGGELTKSFQASADSNGDITIGFQSNSKCYIDWVIIDGKLPTSGRDFIKRTQFNLFGDVRVIGNTVLCQLDSNGKCEDSDKNVSNADVNLSKAPISYSTLDLPKDATIKYARIYWQGRQVNGENWNGTSKTLAGKISIRKASSATFTELTADIQDFSTIDNIPIYSSSADASSIVDSNGTYYIDTAKFYTLTGETHALSPSDGLGAFGGWALVVVYEDLTQVKARSITVFDGYKLVDKDHDAGASISGFLTPSSNDVNSTIYVFTAEGDKYLSDISDRIQMAGDTYNTTLKKLGTFNSRIDINAARVPNLTNNNGIDIHAYDVGTTPGAKGIITNKENGANFNFTSNQDAYFPSLFVFSTELYLPNMCYDYSIKQDGHYLDIDYAASPKAQINARISSAEIELSVYLRNKDADFTAQGISLSSDLNKTIFSYPASKEIYTSNTNGSTLIDRGVPTSSVPLCDYSMSSGNAISDIGCTDGHNIRKGIGDLENQDFIYTQWIIQPSTSGITDINSSLGLKAQYFVNVGGNNVLFPELELGGSEIPLCPPSNSYEPAWGLFNVVRPGSVYNNLYTQISRLPFNASVIFDSDPSTGVNDAPITDINTTLLVEIADMDAYADINASCANPASSLSTPIFVSTNFTSSVFQTPIPLQPTSYYNFAVKNAAYRIWYFTDSNSSLIQNWTATTSNNNKTLLSISGLYDSSVHTACVTECSTSTSVKCFKCIRTNYAKPLCSRDNFSVRPESYDLRIFDINQTNAITNTSNIDISLASGFDPISPPATRRINLAAEYDYRYDLSSTGHDGIAPTPGYTREFSSGSDFNITMNWSPTSTKTGCNNTNSTNLKFYVANGFMEGEKYSYPEIGEYILNVIDKSWTDVDWSNNLHHVVANGFEILPDDCINNVTSSQADTNGRFGCTISTNHGTDGGSHFYEDHLLTYHPYEFDMNDITPSHGINSNTTFNATTFIYMANISLDLNMSYHLRGSINAVGYKGNNVSNFVDGCYAEPLTLTINKTATVAPAYQYRFENKDTAPTPNAIDINGTSGDIAINTGNFIQINRGKMNSDLNLNFDRNISTESNPQRVLFSSYDANCTTAANCSMNVDLITRSTTGTKILDHNITHYYGRTHAPRNRFVGPDGNATVYYEIYCSGITGGIGGIGGTVCNKNILQRELKSGLNSRVTDDPRWFRNEEHNVNIHGPVGVIVQKGVAKRVKNTHNAVYNTIPTGRTLIPLRYDKTRGYPYKATMLNTPDRWLIYNKYNSAAPNNEFEVEFVSTNSSWAGKTDTDSTTNDIGSKKTNRRSMW